MWDLFNNFSRGQGFGYGLTSNIAGGAPGELGGTVVRTPLENQRLTVPLVRPVSCWFAEVGSAGALPPEPAKESMAVKVVKVEVQY